MARGLAATLRSAASIGAIGGFLLGCREGLLSLRENAFAQPGQYLWLYLAVPILAWVGLALALLLPVALVAARRARPPGLWLYAFVLGLAGAASIVLPELGTVEERLTAVGHAATPGFTLTLWGMATVIGVAAAAVAAAAAAWVQAKAPRAVGVATSAVAFLCLLCVVPVVLFLAHDWKWSRDAPERAAADVAGPNVVLISIDTLRADHLGSYGAPDDPSPNLDRLADEGVLFEQAITSSPWTLPAIASMLTGAYPRRHGAGVISNRRTPLGRSALPPDSWTIASALQGKGYRTHAIVTNPYLSLRYGLGQGFADYHNLTIESEAYLSFRQTTVVRLAAWLRPDLVLGDRGEVVSARAGDWLAQNGSRGPFFLWLHYVDPHPPYNRADSSVRKSFRGDTLMGAGDQALDLTLTSPDVARLRSGEIRLGAEEKEAVRALYRAEVRSVDAAVGHVLDQLDRLGLSQQTFVISVADHGEEFWEHGGVEHGHTVYDEVIRVPLLMRWPGKLPAGARVGDIARIIDIAPTVLDLLALPPPNDADGTSLLPLLRGHESVPREALVENLLFADERIGLRTREHKYILWELGKEEAYDLREDPAERRDLTAIDAVLEPLRHLFARADAAAPATNTVRSAPPPDAATVEALRALGYSH